MAEKKEMAKQHYTYEGKTGIAVLRPERVMTVLKKGGSWWIAYYVDGRRKRERIPKRNAENIQ